MLPQVEYFVLSSLSFIDNISYLFFPFTGLCMTDVKTQTVAMCRGGQMFKRFAIYDRETFPFFDT